MDKNQPNPAQQASDAISRENKEWAAACDPIHNIVSSLFDQHCPQGKWVTGPYTLVNAITAELAARELTAAQGVGEFSNTVWMVRDKLTKKLWLYENAVWESKEDAEMCANDMNEEIEDANFEPVALHPGQPAMPSAVDGDAGLADLCQRLSEHGAKSGRRAATKQYNDGVPTHTEMLMGQAVDAIRRLSQPIEPQGAVVVTDAMLKRAVHAWDCATFVDGHGTNESMRRALEAALPVAVGAGEEPDLFWDDDDPEQARESISEVVSDRWENGADNGDVITIQRAIRLPNIDVRLVILDAENSEYDYEIVTPATPAGKGLDHG